MASFFILKSGAPGVIVGLFFIRFVSLTLNAAMFCRIYEQDYDALRSVRFWYLWSRSVIVILILLLVILIDKNYTLFDQNFLNVVRQYDG